MLNNVVKLFAIDLDGTLLQDNKSISNSDLETLSKIGQASITRVAATGRSLFKVKEVLTNDVPFDYIVFSSGAGIYNWKQQKLLHCESFNKHITTKLISYLLEADLNFFVYQPIPANNQFQFHKGAGDCSEFNDYLYRHSGDYKELNIHKVPVEAGQIMAIIPNNEKLFNGLKAKIYSNCNGVKVIRTTSPMGTNYIWLEIFPEDVSKGHGLKWLCDNLGIDKNYTVGIGNDYNDIDMFNFVAYPYLLANGVDGLKKLYNSVKQTNNQSGVSSVAQLFGV